VGQIKGDLDLMGIAQLLQTLSASDCRGVLTIAKGDVEKVIDFGGTGIRLVSGVQRTNPLGEILVRTGKVTLAELDALLAEHRASGKRLGEVVVERGIVTQEAIDFALREQVAEEIFDLFIWSGATFSFNNDRRALNALEPGPLAGVTLDLNLMSLMIEAARRVDEFGQIQKIIPDHRLIAQQIELPSRLDDPSLDRNAVEEVLPLADGSRTVGDIIEASFYPKFTVLRTLYGLSLQGAIKIRDRGDVRGPITVMHRPAASSGSGPGSTASVMVISRLETFRSALGFCMRTARWQAVEASDWTEGRAALARQKIDVIVLDVPLETEDGLSLCREIRADTRIPMILLSGNGTKQAIVHSLQSGAEYVLLKPLKEDLLLDRISEILLAASGELAIFEEGKFSAEG
jgi:CheY-like chemotaxis protein